MFTVTGPAGNTEEKKKWGEITDGILKCIVAKPFSSHWMVESIAFAKENAFRHYF